MSSQPWACPDCTAVYAPRNQSRGHDESCWISRGVEEICDADRDWFERHPFATERRRPITRAEVAEMRGGGFPFDSAPDRWRVLVTQLAPGARTRHFYDPAEARS